MVGGGGQAECTCGEGDRQTRAVVPEVAGGRGWRAAVHGRDGRRSSRVAVCETPPRIAQDDALFGGAL